MERKAKIVATLGPASAGEDVVARLFDAGVDVVRLNLSHGSHDDHRRMIRTVRQVARAQRRFVPVIVDLMGPRCRLGQLAGVRTLAAGEEVSLGEGADLPVEDPSSSRNRSSSTATSSPTSGASTRRAPDGDRRCYTSVDRGGP